MASFLVQSLIFIEYKKAEIMTFNCNYKMLPTVIRTLLKQSYIRSIIILNPGNFTVLLGESGAGKSTLLSLLAGLDSPVEGSILFQGEDIRRRAILTIACTIFPWSFKIIT